MDWAQVVCDHADKLLWIVLLACLLVASYFINRSLRKSEENINRELVSRLKPTRRIVAAANRYSNGLTLIGIRHWDEHMHTQALCYRENGILPSDKDPEQGFLDNQGNFLNRRQAMIVAKAADQIIKRVGGDEQKLYSENLY